MAEGHRLVGDDVARHCFPVGMRVLAVDDDQFSLKVLENLLRKCKYHVTTTTQSTMALEMLRKNRSKFDLLISDVNMVEMDGFKLLEQVVPMELPVIMLSGYNDKDWVKKSVILGACCYLTKPVRIEELQNIWQHVLRKKIRCKEHNKDVIERKPCNVAGEESQGIAYEDNVNQNTKVGQKRKEQIEELEEDGQEKEARSTRKKPRIIWTDELHRRFVAAVNQLGLDNAFPKRILELMKVEGLTRENVASHLQKYKLCLKRPTKQASMVAALGNSNPYVQMGSADGYGDLHTWTGSRKILSNNLSSNATGGISYGLNSTVGLNLRGINSSALLQPVHSQNLPISYHSGGLRNHSSVGAVSVSPAFSYPGISASPEILDYNGSKQNEETFIDGGMEFDPLSFLNDTFDPIL